MSTCRQAHHGCLRRRTARPSPSPRRTPWQPPSALRELPSSRFPPRNPPRAGRSNRPVRHPPPQPRPGRAAVAAVSTSRPSHHLRRQDRTIGSRTLPEPVSETDAQPKNPERLELEELTALQPGLARLMPEVGARFWKAHYAARAENWPLAAWQLREMRKLMRLGAVTRPKYTDDLEEFIREAARCPRSAGPRALRASLPSGGRSGQRVPSALEEALDRLEAAGSTTARPRPLPLALGAPRW